MNDNTERLILEHLRHIRAAVDGVREDVRDLRQRIGAVELGMVALRRELLALAEADAHQAARTDRLGERLDRIERRLDISPT